MCSFNEVSIIKLFIRCLQLTYFVIGLNGACTLKLKLPLLKLRKQFYFRVAKSDMKPTIIIKFIT